MKAIGKKGWLPEQDWRLVQLSVPIACIDVLPIRKSAAGALEVGLIHRETPHQGRRWCLIGGRMARDESFRSGVIREVREALGNAVRCELEAPLQPLFIAEYFSRRRKGSLFDPRQHAIGLTFSARLRGAVMATGEALAFRWFPSQGLPDPAAFGFEQQKVVDECIRRLELS